MADSPDFRFYTGWLDDPRVVKLLRRLHRHEGWPFYHLVRLFAWTTANRPTGDLAGMSGEDVEIAAQWTREPGIFAPLLAELGFLDGAEGSYKIHGWEDDQLWCVERVEIRKRAKAGGKKVQASRSPEERSAAGKKAARARWDKERALCEKIARSKRRHTPQEWAAMLEICERRCVECGADGVELVPDHIVPITWKERPDATDGIENLQPKCRSCNAGKGLDETDYRPENWRELLTTTMRARGSHHASYSLHDASNYAKPQPSPAQPSKLPARVKSNTNPNASRIESPPAASGGLSQDQRDTWDLRRFQDAMQRSAPQPGIHIADPHAFWQRRVRDAAFDAGIAPARIVALLKQHYPDDPNVDSLYPRLVNEKAATA